MNQMYNLLNKFNNEAILEDLDNLLVVTAAEFERSTILGLRASVL
jgi:hypothetical protein